MSTHDFLLLLHRVEFGLSAGFHFLFVPLSIGLLVCINVLRSRHVLSRRPAFDLAARYWQRYFLLSWVLGAGTGYALRHQLRTQWALFGDAAAPVLNHMLEIEGLIGPWMLVAVCTLAFGRRLLHPVAYMLAGWLLLLLMGVQSNTILSVNAWMQQPVGVSFAAEGWRLTSLSQVFFSETAVNKTSHTLMAAMLTGAVFVLAVSARDLVKQKTAPEWTASVQVAAWMALISAWGLLGTGHASIATISRVQPMKFATFEAHWKAEPGSAPLIVLAVPDEARHRNRYELRIPDLMSWLVGHQGSPAGLDDLSALNRAAAAQALKHPDHPDSLPWLMLADQVASSQGERWSGLPIEARASAIAEAARPPMWPVFLAFRVMVACGLWLCVLSGWVFVARHALARGQHRRLLILLRLSMPLPWLAILSGWAVAEIGRQPWTVYQRLTTAQSFQAPALQEGVLAAFGLLLAALAISALCLRMARSIRKAGPQCASWLLTRPLANKLWLRCASASRRT